MKKRQSKYNPKRKLKIYKECDFEKLKDLAKNIKYGGNPEHKKNPGDFNLLPSSYPRPGKSLCDAVKIFKKNEAKTILIAGLKKGMISERQKDGWPQNIWAVLKDEYPLEAQLENSINGTYHGYPLQKEDPFSDHILKEWKERPDVF
jgi:hypothetical protein